MKNVKMVEYASFNERFFEAVTDEIQWFNRKGILPLTRERIATIELAYSKCTSTFDGYRVKIVHVNSGELDLHDFKFNDYLYERVDQRTDYKNGFSIEHNVCKREGCVKWYIAEPSMKDVDTMAELIHKYIMLWR